VPPFIGIMDAPAGIADAAPGDAATAIIRITNAQALFRIMSGTNSQL
jgi:hypothetical protein